MEKFIPYEKLSKKGSNPTAAGGGSREGSEWQRSARCKSALPDAASAGHRNRAKRKMDLAKRQTWGAFDPVTRKPQNSKAYNRNKSRNWKRDHHETNSGTFLFKYRFQIRQIVNDPVCNILPKINRLILG